MLWSRKGHFVKYLAMTRCPLLAILQSYNLVTGAMDDSPAPAPARPRPPPNIQGPDPSETQAPEKFDLVLNGRIDTVK